MCGIDFKKALGVRLSKISKLFRDVSQQPNKQMLNTDGILAKDTVLNA